MATGKYRVTLILLMVYNVKLNFCSIAKPRLFRRIGPGARIPFRWKFHSDIYLCRGFLALTVKVKCAFTQAYASRSLFPYWYRCLMLSFNAFSLLSLAWLAERAVQSMLLWITDGVEKHVIYVPGLKISALHSDWLYGSCTSLSLYSRLHPFLFFT